MTSSVYIIAEAGVNHNGSMDRARALIDAAAEAGADAVKFQTFKADRLVTRSAAKAKYQQEKTDANESQYDMLRALELSESDHDALAAHCANRDIEFLSTAFDEQSLDMLIDRFNITRIKMPSGELTNAPLMLHAARKRRPIILSTGMSTLGEIEQALGVLAWGYTADIDAAPNASAFASAYAAHEGQQALRERVTILHCTTAYPTPYADVNLRAMDTIRDAFGLPVGYSDHTLGLSVPTAAVARGAVLIEKHFTTDRALPGPDHSASLEPDELANMVRAIREVELALGVGLKAPTTAEVGNVQMARKSLVAAVNIAIGDVFSTHNLTVRRPGSGLSPMRYWDVLGTKAVRAYAADEVIS
jgi:N-acetylneuraminate synthase